MVRYTETVLIIKEFVQKIKQGQLDERGTDQFQRLLLISPVKFIMENKKKSL